MLTVRLQSGCLWFGRYGEGKWCISTDPLRAALRAIQLAEVSAYRRRPQNGRGYGEWFGARQETPNAIRAHRAAIEAQDMAANIFTSNLEVAASVTEDNLHTQEGAA